jgi:hypothetical protein
MSRERLATAYDNLAEAYAQVALELRGVDSPPAAPSLPAARPVAAGAGAPALVRPSTFTACPKHGKDFHPSKNTEWPAYCSAMTDDPAWGKPKQDRDGNSVLYCRITSKNAGEWAAVHAATADVPF